MHLTFVKSASAVAIASILAPSLAAVAPRQAVPSGGFTCTDDALYKGFFSNSQISSDVQTFCSSELGLSDSTICDHSLTTRTTVYPSASYHTITTTSTTTSYDSTVTVTETGAVVLDMSKKKMARNAAPRPEVQITAAPQVVRKALDARVVEKRQGASAYDAGGAAAQVYSACECGLLAGTITSDVDYVATCFPYTSTVTNEIDVYQATTTTAFTTVEGAVTTVTVIQNITSNILTVISAMNTSSPTWTGPWTGSWNGSWTGSWTGWSGSPTVSPTPSPTPSPTITSDGTSSALTTTSWAGVNTTWTWNWTSSESTSTTLSMSSVISPFMPNATTSTTWTSTISTSSSWSLPTTQPSGCPYINGTTYTPPGSCNVYTRVCGLSFADSDFYGTFPYYPSPELCASLCDADSNGMSPCLGIVWNTSAIAGSHQSNCRQLESLSDPIMDPTAIALILTGQDPSCNKVVNISSSTTISTSISSTIGSVNPTNTSDTSYSTSSGTGRPPYTHSHNYTWVPTGTWNYTRSWPTGSQSHSYNHTRTHMINSTSANPYMPSTTSYSNVATSMNSTSMTSTTWMNSTSSGTAPISPIMPSNSTCPASTITSVSTQYATLWNNATVTLGQITTVFATNISTVTVTATDTTTETDILTITETDTLTKTETDSSVSTETDVSITTDVEISTETDVITITDVEVSTETDLVTTTDFEVSTETDVTTVLVTTSVAAPPGRYAWHGAWRA